MCSSSAYKKYRAAELPELTDADALICIRHAEDSGTVRITGRSAVNCAKYTAGELDLCCDDSILALTDITSDTALFDILASAVTGCILVIPDENEIGSPNALDGLISDTKTSVICADTESHRLLAGSLGTAPSLRKILVQCADDVPAELTDAVRRTYPNADIRCVMSFRGTALWSVMMTAEDSGTYISPIANCELHIFTYQSLHFQLRSPLIRQNRVYFKHFTAFVAPRKLFCFCDSFCNVS